MLSPVNLKENLKEVQFEKSTLSPNIILFTLHCLNVRSTLAKEILVFEKSIVLLELKNSAL